MIEQEDYIITEKLLKLKIITATDVAEMERIIKKYLDKTANICRHCPAQIRFFHKRLGGWFNNLPQRIDEEQIIMVEQPVVKKKAGRPCVKCKQK
jgi:hypothetical protein